MRGTHNFNGDTLGDCSVRPTSKHLLFTMMSGLSADELKKRISEIKDRDTRILAQAHADTLSAIHADALKSPTADWTGPASK